MSIFTKVALILVDIQYDFLETGSLPVPQASSILPNVRRLISFVQAHQGLIIATQDWHPKNHASFASNHRDKQPLDTVQLTYDNHTCTQVLWPDHCVQESPGAALVKEIQNYPSIIVRKGTNAQVDSYSGFADNQYHEITSLARHLYQHQIDTVIICGLAADYCVKMTCLDAIKFGFNTILIQDTTQPVIPADLASTLDLLASKGVSIVPTTDAFITSAHHDLL